MAAGATYEPIATTTVTTSTATVTFSSIPSTYTDLILVAGGLLQTTGGNGLRIRFNNDSGSNYSDTDWLGNGSTYPTNRETSTTSNYAASTTFSSTNVGVAICQIMDYASTTKYKTLISLGGQALSDVNITINLWRSTSAINRIDLAMGSTFPSDNFSKVTLTLYGITAA